MKSITLVTVVVLTLASAGVALAHPGEASSAAAGKPQSVTMRGEVVDPQCFFTHGSRGLAHVSCAQTCAQGGQGLAFLEESSGVIYPLIAAGHGKNQNALVLDKIGRPVIVKGVTFRKGANAVLLIQSVVVAPGAAR